ncbi:citrate synthase [Deinococcus yavapaiensis]|uniref:citrate synthase (unknown stereospecificity) n=1 Tax=Deinococcus yavapaiensis KR-236 TaxID=694435 RepID=A0A318SQA7_9DEIO|nr:citrate/2-methylcitrate synthase [Deinococcus yavapaiensis]PYE54953.1 citrate synthase [Deinococcus yavapaiensis KR-236]
MTSWISAAEATERLGVNKATLYAYVSRGLVRSRAAGGTTRARTYAADDIATLVRRKEDRREPQRVARTALDWGSPVLESELTLIADDRLFYRGMDATELARFASVEEVAGLLWSGELRAPPLPLHAQLALVPLPSGAHLLEAFGHALTHAGAHDLQAGFTRADDLPKSAARVLALLYATVERFERVPPAPDLPLHRRLARALGRGDDRSADLVRRALVLTADHELNVSSFTARCVASSGASVHHAALAGLCALQGVRHGLATELAFDLLADAGEGRPRDALRRATRRHGSPPGFGHTLYPNGDPRAKALVDVIEDDFRDEPIVRVGREVAEIAHTELGLHPNVDFALSLAAHVLKRGALDGVALFALGRTVGWLAHAIEAARSQALIRPRAKYVGPLPNR